MRRQQCVPGRPPWWPEGEPWPPRDPAHQWRAGRRRFFRRFAWLALAVLMLSVCGALALVWVAATIFGLAAPSPRSVGVLAGVMVGAVVTAAALVLVGIMRRLGRPLGDVMD